MTDKNKPKLQPNRRARLWVQDLRGASEEPGDPWVSGTPAVVQRVPGIDEAQDTTYVEGAPRRRSWYLPVLLGMAIGLVVVAIFAAVVVSADSSGSPEHSELGAAATASSSTPPTSISTTTTTTATPTTAPARSTAATPTTTAPLKLAAAVVPATPRATANPAAPLFVKVPLPAGVGATLTRCTWQPTNGGRYEAAGTVTNGPSTNHGWTLTMHWLQNDREIGQQSAVLGLTAGQSAPWSLILGAPNAPADPFSCALTAA